ncbi:hypothetical protein [Breznakiella homolactica]|uniref:Uncharacterized protein n=1 Tax=Breznakiella homolactica TaxID=2798577 RepID=A0A7T8BBX4_9SPIR|nr:hypothetical protein [Breznakiella homolactica]QQO10836.1 hypothetical protein JFL75_07940 [Breznakiella homolactica]
MKNRITWIIPMAAVFFLLISPVWAGPRRDTKKNLELVLLHTNDRRSSVLPDAEAKGLAERATFIKSVRETSRNVLLVDAGTVYPDRSVPGADITAYNMMGYDAAIFDYHGSAALPPAAVQSPAANFPFLCANIKTMDGSFLGNSPYIIKQFGGIKVGLFGIIAPVSYDTDNYIFIDEIDASLEMVEILASRVDIIIAITNTGNIPTGNRGITSRDLAEAVRGIDIIIDGSFQPFPSASQKAGNTFIVSADEWGRYAGQGTLIIAEGKLAGFDWQPVRIDGYPPDAQVMRELMKPYITMAEANFRESIGETEAAEDPFAEIGIYGLFDLGFGIGGAEISSHKLSAGGGGALFAAFRITNRIRIQADAALAYTGFRFGTSGNGLYSNGDAELVFTQMRLSALVKYRFYPGKGVLSAGGGIEWLLIPSGQNYTDDILDSKDHFLKPPMNLGAVILAEYGYPLGPGQITGGLRVSAELLENSYTFNGQTVHIGRRIRISPSIGYSFFLTKEKNRGTI